MKKFLTILLASAFLLVSCDYDTKQDPTVDQPVSVEADAPVFDVPQTITIEDPLVMKATPKSNAAPNVITASNSALNTVSWSYGSLPMRPYSITMILFVTPTGPTTFTTNSSQRLSYNTGNVTSYQYKGTSTPTASGLKIPDSVYTVMIYGRDNNGVTFYSPTFSLDIH